jgi:hypothetical protein
VLDVRARYNHPTFPLPTFLTTLTWQECFKEYISNEFGSPDLHLRGVSSTTNQEPLHKEVNATIANSPLNTVIPHAVQIATTEWVSKAIFPDKALPVPFNDLLLDKIPECWDKSAQRFSSFPDTMGEQAVQGWLNHLSHTLEIHHCLIKLENTSQVLSDYADGDVDTDEADQIGGSVGSVDSEVDGVDPERNAFIIAGGEDCSFSRVSHKVAPSGGCCLRKPDIILINQNIRHFLKNSQRRPRWHHVEAVVEVLLSAP